MGVGENDAEVLVLNGDLTEQREVDCIPIRNENNIIVAEIPETYDSESTLIQLANKDNLIPTNEIEIKNSHLFKVRNKLVFPERRIYGVTRLLIQSPALWKQAQLALTHTRSSLSSAKMFGIGFKSALQKMDKLGILKARFYCPKKDSFAKEGVVAEMLVLISLDKRGYPEIQCWQGVENERSVFYTHGIMDKGRQLFTHFDGAMISFDISEKERLFRENTKIKTGNYKKMFRLDGEISIQDVYELSYQFFPLDELVDEYFEMTPCNSLAKMKL